MHFENVWKFGVGCNKESVCAAVKHLYCVGSSDTATDLARPIDLVTAELLAEHVDSAIHTAAQTLRLLYA